MSIAEAIRTAVLTEEIAPLLNDEVLTKVLSAFRRATRHAGATIDGGDLPDGGQQ